MSNLKKLFAQNKKTLTEESILSRELDKYYVNRQLEGSEKRLGFFHPSILAKGIECERWWGYFVAKEIGDVSQEAFSAETLAIMDVGTAIHDRMHYNFYKMGILEGVWQCVCCNHKWWAISPKEFCPNCKNELYWARLSFMEVPLFNGFIKGHADGILNYASLGYDVRRMLELKSIKNVTRPNATYGFEVLKEDKAEEDHSMQGQIYLSVWEDMVQETQLHNKLVKFNEQGNGFEFDDFPVEFQGPQTIGVVKELEIVYVGKNNSHRRVYVEKKSPMKIKWLKQRAIKIYEAAINKEQESLEGYCFSLDEKECKKKKCRYKEFCFPNGCS